MQYFSRANRNFGKVKKATAPVRVIVVSFVLLILAGTFLLTLPVSSAAGSFTHPLDALFTATSATCVTGLSVVDTTGHWSPFGQAVVLLLIQLGAWACPPSPQGSHCLYTGGWDFGR